MMDQPPPLFDMDTVRKAAGGKIFARGEAYHREGRVEILSLGSHRVTARVLGGQRYRVLLERRTGRIDGECSCPAYDDWDFCKHMVAAALAANARTADGPDEDIFVRIRDYLRGKDTGALIEMIVDLAERDDALFRKLEIAVAASGADDGTLETRLRRAIDEATAVREFIDYRMAGDWAAGVDAVLDALRNFASGPRTGTITTLAIHAIDRIERAIDAIDDSDGHCGMLLEQARQIHRDACRAAKPDPAKLARDLFDREMHDGFGTFANAAIVYQDILGEAGLAEYRRLAASAWEALPPLTPTRRGQADMDSRYPRLAAIMDFFAQRDADVEARIAIRAKDLTSPGDYLRLAEFCRAEGREKDALRYAGEGLWVFEDARPDRRLVLFTADLQVEAGRKDDAAAHLWRAFEKAPDFGLYHKLGKIEGKAARERALTHLKERLVLEKASAWYRPSDLLIQILIHGKDYEAAWRAMHDHGASASLKEKLAKESEMTHPNEALAFYNERVETLVGLGGNSSYEEAARLITRMAALRGAKEQAAYVADLKTRHRRKRNFMRFFLT